MVNSKKTVFLFVGDDDYSKVKAIDDLASSFFDGPAPELDYKVFYGDESTASDILSLTSTIPFLSKKRMVVIRDFESLAKEDKKSIFSYMKNPSQSSYLVIESGNAALLKEQTVLEYANVKRFDKPKETEITSFISKMLSSSGKKIDEDALSILKETQGNDTAYLKNELDKLVSFVGEKKSICREDVEEVVGKSLVSSAFDITWAIGRKDAKNALKIAYELVSNGKRHHEIIGILGWHLKRLLEASALYAEGKSDSYIAGVINIARRDYDKFFKQVRLFKTDDIKLKLRHLLDADLSIKRTKFDPGTILELAIIRLCLG